jgi:hypothetical protein
MNNRKAIRDALKALLLDETSAGENVYSNRETAAWQSELPSILIYTESEDAQPRAANTSQSYIRDLELRIDLKLEATENVDDALDDFVSEVEEILFSNPSFGGVTSSRLTRTEVRIDEQGENSVGVASLSVLCKYIS